MNKINEYLELNPNNKVLLICDEVIDFIFNRSVDIINNANLYNIKKYDLLVVYNSNKIIRNFSFLDVIKNKGIKLNDIKIRNNFMYYLNYTNEIWCLDFDEPMILRNNIINIKIEHKPKIIKIITNIEEFNKLIIDAVNKHKKIYIESGNNNNMIIFNMIRKSIYECKIGIFVKNKTIDHLKFENNEHNLKYITENKFDDFDVIISTYNIKTENKFDCIFNKTYNNEIIEDILDDIDNIEAKITYIYIKHEKLTIKNKRPVEAKGIQELLYNRGDLDLTYLHLDMEINEKGKFEISDNFESELLVANLILWYKMKNDNIARLKEVLINLGFNIEGKFYVKR